MHTVTVQRRASRGFTLIEIMVGLAILAILLGIGVPSMKGWLTANSAISAAEFYADGLKMARAEAVKRNGVTRFVLTQNTTTKQYDWQIDLCMPSAGAPCDDSNGTWSTAKATNGDKHAEDFKSLQRSATNLPGPGLMTVAVSPANATAIYFTPLGWVDGGVANTLSKIELTPVVADAFPTTAVVVTLAGVVTKCNPKLAASDSRSCPP